MMESYKRWLKILEAKESDMDNKSEGEEDSYAKQLVVNSRAN